MLSKNLNCISVIIITKNAETTLFPVLKAIRDFKEVILLDTGSTDRTLTIASGFSNVKVRTSPFIGFGSLRNLAANHASSDWILSLESDEIISDELSKEISSLKLNPHSVYSFPRHNYFNGRLIKWCGWYPERYVRLYHKTRTLFSSDQIQEHIISENMSEIKRKHPIKHFSFLSTSDFLKKMDMYSNLFAKQYQGKKHSSFSKALLYGFYTFIKSYLFQCGFIGGKEGFIISLYKGQSSFYKYLKLWELNQNIFKKIQHEEKF